MIRNIIFDVGQVLKRFDPDAITAPYVGCPEDARLIRSVCFASEQWLMLDRGTIGYPEAVKVWKAALPERLHGALDGILAHWFESLPDIPETAELVRRLSERGYALYILSNFSVRFWDMIPYFPVYPCFRGAVVSSDVKLLKPMPEIYETLLSRYSLDRGECVFIDDSAANTEGAERVGIRALRYDGSISRLTDGLAALGVRV